MEMEKKKYNPDRLRLECYDYESDEQQGKQPNEEPDRY